MGSFLRNLTVKEFWKSVYTCRSYDQKSSVLFSRQYIISQILYSIAEGEINYDVYGIDAMKIVRLGYQSINQSTIF